MPRTRTIYFYLRLLLFLIYIINGLIIISKNSVTNDEMDHWSYGKRVLMNRPEKIYPYDDASAMPISGFNALPRAVEQLINPGLEKSDMGFSDIMNGRYITLLICLLIGIYIYKWVKESFDENAAIFSLFLFVFCPNINANATLLTTDAYAALFTLTTAYYFQKFILKSSWKNFLFFSVSIAVSQVVKQSLVLLPVFFGILSLIILVQRKKLFRTWRINLARIFTLGVITLFIINLAFLFKGTGMSLSQYEFFSSFFRKLQSTGISEIPLPLPAPFIQGYDILNYLVSLGSGHEFVSARSYLLGDYFTGGRWYYYPVVLFFKTPLSVILLLGVILVKLFRKPAPFFKTAYPVTLALFFLVIFSLFNSSQHSIRHLLMIYPLAYVAIGQVINQNFLRKKAMPSITILYTLITFYYFFPNLISYTNEFILPKRNAYKIIASSNIDYGQCRECLVNYQEKHPEVKTPGGIHKPGTYIIGINYYLDLEGKGRYTWLQKYPPYSHVNHCLLLIRVPEVNLNSR